MAFYSGQKVVCLDGSKNANPIARFVYWAFSVKWPVEGEIYTILKPSVLILPELPIGVELAEIKNLAIMRYAFRRTRFRPLVERQTSIEVFTEILRNTKTPVEAMALTSQPRRSETE